MRPRGGGQEGEVSQMYLEDQKQQPKGWDGSIYSESYATLLNVP